MNRFFKLYKFLFEDDKYKNIGLNSKVAYCVYRDLIQQNRNVKKEPIIVPEVKEELVEKITDKDLEDAQKVLKEYKVGKIDLEASKILKNIKLYLYKAKEEELIKIAIRILVKKKREEDRLELLKKLTTYEVSYALERCKNSVRNEELVINKLIKYIETKIEDANYWN